MKKTLLLLTTLIASTVYAAPENGWWWNPSQPGTGYNIETQSNTLFVATFVYDDAGNPVWYSGSGELNRNDMVTVDLLRSEGGQCLGCQFTDAIPSNSGFRITLDFESNSKGTVTLDGQKTPIERFSFAYGNGLQRLIGGWTISSLSNGVFGLGFSDFINYTSIDGERVEGTRLMNSGHRSIVSQLDDGSYIGLTQLRNGYRAVTDFTAVGLNRIAGLFVVVDANTPASEAVRRLRENGALFVGFRSVQVDNAGARSSNNISMDTEGMKFDLEELAIHAQDIDLPVNPMR